MVEMECTESGHLFENGVFLVEMESEHFVEMELTQFWSWILVEMV